MASEKTLYSAQVCYIIGRLGSLLENGEDTSIRGCCFFWAKLFLDKSQKVLQKSQALHKM